MADSSSSVSAAAAVAIPHFGRVYLTGIWIASLLYGELYTRHNNTGL